MIRSWCRFKIYIHSWVLIINYYYYSLTSYPCYESICSLKYSLSKSFIHNKKLLLCCFPSHCFKNTYLISFIHPVSQDILLFEYHLFFTSITENFSSMYFLFWMFCPYQITSSFWFLFLYTRIKIFLSGLW